MKRSALASGLAITLLCLWLPTSTAALMDWIFADSFESGDATAWSWANGLYLVIPEAASEGAFGLRVPATFDEPAWVQDENGSDEAVVRADFDFNADNLAMTSGDSFALYVGWVVDDATAAFAVSLVDDVGQIGLRITAWDATGGSIISPPVPLPGPGWHRIGLEYGVGTGSGGSGEMRLFINGALEAEVGPFQNQDLVVNSLRLGVVDTIDGVDQGTSGSFDIDVYSTVRLFDPWPCSASSTGNPTDEMPVCLDGEGRSTDVATGGCGDGVVVWRGSEDLRSQRSRLGGIYGRPVGGSVRGINETFLIVQDESASTPAIAMDAVCRSAVAWRSSPDGDVIVAGVFDAAGVQQTPLVPVAAGADSEEWPAIAASDSGRFFVVWRRELATEQSIWGRYFEDDATPLGQEFQIGEGNGAVSPPSVAMSADGFAVVLWEHAGGIYGHLFDDGGASLGQIVLSDGPGNGQPSVAMMADGGFVAVWTRQGGDRPVLLRRFDPSGGPVWEEQRVDVVNPADCSEPDVAVSPSDEITVVWSSLRDELSSILGRRFTPDGEPATNPFEIERSGQVWLPNRPRVAAAERVLVSFSEETEFLGFARGSVIGAQSEIPLFADGFENGDLGAWSTTVP